MFDLSIWEIAVIGVVAVLVIGPKELPRALMTAGKWIRKFRAVTGSFRSGLDNMIRETEMQELEKQWATKNQQIMAEHPDEMLPLSPPVDGSSDITENNDNIKSQPLEESVAEEKSGADIDANMAKDSK